MIDDGVLSRVSLLRDLNEGARRLIRERGELRRCRAGSILWRAGSDPTGLCILLEGRVRVVRNTNGRQRVIHTEGPGGTLGEVPLFEGATYPATAIAASHVTVLVLGRDVITDAIAEDPRFALALLARLAARVRHLIIRFEETHARSVAQRLAAHLRERAAASANGVFTLGGTHRDVAEELGTVREVIVRTLREMREAGLVVSAGRGRYRLTDPAALDRLSGPTD